MDRMIEAQNGGCKNMNILCATDEKYAPYCGVMLTSFLENHKSFHTEVHIIVKSRLKAEKKLKRLEKRYDVEVNIIEFPFIDVVSTIDICHEYLTVETLYRLFVTDILPKELDRVLYLDCDIIVDSDVSELFSMDLDGISALVAVDTPWHTMVSHPKRLGYPEEKGYFNAGVMMINLEYWREHNISSQCYAFLKKNFRNLSLFDQDVLNVILLYSKKYVSLTYNFQHTAVLKEYYDLYDEETKAVVSSQKPKIIHYTTRMKPWLLYSYGGPFCAVWRRYKRRSMWWHLMDILPKEKPFNYFIKRYFLWPFGFYLPPKEVIITGLEYYPI